MPAKKKTGELCRTICEVQSQIKYISENKVKDVINDLCKKGTVIDFAYALHDKDTYTDDDELEDITHKAGEAKEPHIHAVLRFNNSYKFSTVANWFELPVACIRVIKTTFDTTCAYLIHKNDPKKFQYDPSEIHSSFDYADFLSKLKEKEKALQSNENYMKMLKNRILEEVEAGTLRGYNFHENYKYSDRVMLRSYLNKAIDEIIKTKLNSNEERNLEVIYIHGTSGAGKTAFAKMTAKARKFVYVTSDDDRDPVESYDSHPCMILDEMRPSSMKLTSFLKLVDNNTESLAGARYHGKAFIECRLIIITSILQIEEFFEKLQENDNETAIQIKRRCKTMFEMDRDYIEISEWDDYSRQYVYCGKMKNPIPAIYKIEPKSVEELRAKACVVAGIDLSELDITLKEEFEGIVGEPIPFEKVYPTIPKDIVELIKHDPFPYLHDHPEYKAIPLREILAK